MENKLMTTRIEGHNWTVIICDRAEIDGNDGRTIPTQMQIKIANDMCKDATEITYMHELVHAIMDGQGRCYERKMNVEMVAEFIAWNIEYLTECLMSFREFCFFNNVGIGGGK